MRTLCTIVVLGLIAIVYAFLLSVSFWLALVAFLALAILFIYNALQKVPAKPPHKAILMFWGRRLEVVLSEGWNWVPFYPFLFDLALVKVEKVNKEFNPQQVRTPDRAVISISASITFVPGITGIKGKPESYIAYLN
ncbi:MAG: hypothetical protein Q8K40_00435, partial [Ignavibacteria bacterium]|nr:hypothetical protein [Ignavibacteria bacterium]